MCVVCVKSEIWKAEISAPMELLVIELYCAFLQWGRKIETLSFVIRHPGEEEHTTLKSALTHSTKLILKFSDVLFNLVLQGKSSSGIEFQWYLQHAVALTCIHSRLQA